MDGIGKNIPSPYLSQELNEAIIKSEIEGGVDIRQCKADAVLHVQTQNTLYVLKIINPERGEVEIQGHPRYCPTPTRARIHGSTFGGSVLKIRFIGRGMHMEFSTDTHPGAITTTEIKEIHERGTDVGR
jgi:hypothetical protein